MPLNTTPNALHPISLFGGEIPDALTAIEWEESGIEPGEFRDAPPDTPLPASDTLGLFEASWERFHFLKDLATTASGTWRPDAQLTPRRSR